MTRRSWCRLCCCVIEALLRGGVAVCLPDLRGTGETRPGGDDRGRQSASTSLSAAEWMLGQTLLGSRLRDLRLVLGHLRGQHLRGHASLDDSRIALWGDSFAPVNGAAEYVEVPWDAAKLPAQSEPLGGLLALFGALYEPEVSAIYARGGLESYRSLLRSPFLYVPHDALVPGALTAGDLEDVTAALSPRPVRLEGMVDGVNRRQAAVGLERSYAHARTAYRGKLLAPRLVLNAQPAAGADVARWLAAQLKEPTKTKKK
jgi:hypothetical protein